MASDDTNESDTNHSSLRFHKEWLWVLLPISIYIVLISILPCWTMEDAYIMLRYSQNIASGFGIVYNPGGPPVYGCTSLLTTLVLAGLIFVGVPPILASQILGILLSITLILLVYVIERTLLGISNFAAIVSLMVLAVSHMVSLSLMGFDSLLFAVLVTLLFGLTVRVLQKEKTPKIGIYHWLLLITAFLLSLSRPEGAIVVVVTLVIIVWQSSYLGRLRLSLTLVLPYIIGILAFYSWTTLYFGWPLPNPFYIKTGITLIYPLSLLLTLFFFGVYSILVLIAVAAFYHACRTQNPACGTLRSLFFAAIPAFLYILAYLAVDQEFNHEIRFQFPFLPILVILFGAGLYYFRIFLPHSLPQVRLPSPHGVKRWALIFLIVGAILFPLTRGFLILPWGELPEPIRVGQALHQYKDQGYTILITEAGRIPFYAEWHTIDAYGLNDPIIAHFGLNESYIAFIDPEIILFNSKYYTDYVPEWELDPDEWEALCLQLYHYAVNSNYTRACVYRVYLRMSTQILYIGNHWIFVRDDLPDRNAIINTLQTIPGLDYTYPP